MRLILPLTFILIISCSQKNKPVCNYITDYYQTIYQAELSYELKKYDRAYELYQSAFNTCTPINTYTYNEIGKYVEICLILGHDKQALDFIELDLKNGDELKWKLEDPMYIKIFTTEGGQKLIANYDKIRSEYLKGINLELRKEIQEMSRLDQLYRNGQYQENKQDSIDKISTNRLKEIFEQFRYPNDQVIGSYSVDRTHTDIITMLLHTSDSIRMSYFVPKLKEFVKAGTCSPKTLGQVIDQFYLYNGEPQTHGTYESQDSKYANMIGDRDQVNKNRISIGLPPLELDEKIDSVKRLNYPERYRQRN
jgi:hypothetical protein